MLPREIVSFVFPRVSMFPETSSRETLTLSRKQNSLFPEGAHIINKCILLWHKRHCLNAQEIQYVCFSIISALEIEHGAFDSSDNSVRGQYRLLRYQEVRFFLKKIQRTGFPGMSHLVHFLNNSSSFALRWKDFIFKQDYLSKNR